MENLRLIFYAITPIVLIITFVACQLIKHIGKYRFIRWKEDLETLENQDAIIIRHQDYDSIAVYICRIKEKGVLCVRPFKNNILQDIVHIRTDQFVKKVD